MRKERVKTTAPRKHYKPGWPFRSRIGVPDGMRRYQVLPLWEKAEAQAKRFITIMEDADKLPKNPEPMSEEAMAKEALYEAFRIAVGPLTDAKTKVPAARLVLEFTKAKPEAKSRVTLDNAEAWLDALEKDMKKKDGGHSGDPA